MHLTFRQGISRYQTDIYGTPTFLRKSAANAEYVDLIVSPDPTIVIFAHRAATYVVEESKTVTHAWGPFPPGTPTKYLYWDINLLDAKLSRGATAYPLITGGVAPLNPGTDQHWYDTTISQMKVWNGSKWVDKVRVFAATYSNTAVITPAPLGSQVNENGEFEAGNLVLDAYEKPLRQSDGTFVTSVTELSVINAATKKVKFEAEIYTAMAEEYIPKYSFVQARPNRRIILARSDDWKSRIAGIATEDMYQSEVGNVTTDGLVRNEQWSWPPEAISRPVFCGVTGEVTLSPPSVGVNQIAGYVYDFDSIFINIKQVCILDDITNEPGIAPPQPPNAPVADFYATPTIGVAPLSVRFTSTSLHAPTSLEWDFTNSGVTQATTPEATFTYTVPGTYTVRLRASNAYGQDDEVKTNLVTVNAAPNAGINTNLGIQLGGPLQVGTTQRFSVSVTVSNDGHRGATNVVRQVTIDDVGSTQVEVSGLPTGSEVTRGHKKTIVIFPTIVSMGSGQYANTSFSITAPAVTGTIQIRAGVGSPETDSTPSDNLTELSIKVK